MTRKGALGEIRRRSFVIRASSFGVTRRRPQRLRCFGMTPWRERAGYYQCLTTRDRIEHDLSRRYLLSFHQRFDLKLHEIRYLA
jgi:hypothetical protein